VRLSLRESSPEQILELMNAGTADIAITTEAQELYQDLVTLPCYQWNRCVITPLNHRCSNSKN